MCVELRFFVFSLAWAKKREKGRSVCGSLASHRPKSGQSNYASNERKNWGEMKCASALRHKKNAHKKWSQKEHLFRNRGQKKS